MSAGWLLGAVVMTACSGVPGLWRPAGSRRGEVAAVWLMTGGGFLAAVAAIPVLVTGVGTHVSFPWQVPGGSLALRLDPLAAIFVLQIALIAVCGSVYGLSYWAERDHPASGRRVRLAYGLATAGMMLVVTAHNAVLFLVGWEVMALAAFFALTAEDHDDEVRSAGRLYLFATRFSTLCLFALFSLLHAASGNFAFQIPGNLNAASTAGTAIFVLALVGFGLKAGIMPLHVWLPGAHASAPTHVSALMSGVLIKMGIYGLLRVTSSFMLPPAWWGVTLLLAGVVSGVLGVALALGQHDIKRLLAYHSVENIGIICMGLGLGLLGRAAGRDDLALLGVAGALLHTWNHGLFKSLLFLSAGAVVHATHTRTIDRLGALLGRMPLTGALFLIGAVAICGLPPLNGFVSELLVYVGLLRGAITPAPWVWLPAVLGVASLAAIGGLALACFVKAFGAMFLGHDRSGAGAHAHDPPASMLAPMVVLATACAAVGLGPLGLASPLQNVSSAWGLGGKPGASVTALAPLAPTSYLAWALVGLAGVAGLLFVRRTRRLTPGSAVVGTWDCGFAAPSGRMQYTASSFAQLLVGLLGWTLRPTREVSALDATFPARARFHTHVPDLVLDRALMPLSRAVQRALTSLRWVQGGSINAYLAYLLAALLLTLMWRS